ncbi:MAG: hypothetical protein A4E34_01836 [Methanoregula sp. PtaU1.Bin006]|nr:MAG: hypothetical protein A4E33_01896 [Methanoregula sp. PtaB.Bin085]OPY33513.1 MAG: hypothetical protein A4E34_01836 [Methanoregula sp. PtaU1.Bin006]
MLIASHCGCGCGGMLSVEDEIKALEVHRQHMKLQLEMIGKRISGLQKAGWYNLSGFYPAPAPCVLTTT